MLLELREALVLLETALALLLQPTTRSMIGHEVIGTLDGQLGARLSPRVHVPACILVDS